MKKYLSEKYLIWIVALIFWGFLSYTLYYYQTNTQGADTTFAAQILYNLKHSVVMNTSMGISIVESMDHIWGLSAQQVCTQSLGSGLSSLPWFHYYFVIYLLAPFAQIMDIPLLIATSTALIYTSIFLFTYLYSRKKGLNQLLAVLLVLLVSQHPLWSYGVYGQYYFNRLFLPFSAIFIWLLDKKKVSYPWLIITGFLAVSSNEIYGITLATIILSQLWINKVVSRKMILLAAIFCIYSAIAIFLIHQNLGLVSNQIGFIDQVIRDGLLTTAGKIYQDFISLPTQTFLLINLTCLGVFALVGRRTFLPFILILLPNLLINIGGAEKTGWSTHYHMSYFIPLIWLSIISLSRWRQYVYIQTSCIVLLFIITCYVNPYTLERNSPPFISFKYLYSQYKNIQHKKPLDQDFRDKLRLAVGEGQTATMPEAISYHLYDRNIYYYPHMLDSVSNVVFRYDQSLTGDDRFSSINYGHQDTNLDACIIQRMKTQNFDFTTPIIVGDWAVIKRQVISSDTK